MSLVFRGVALLVMFCFFGLAIWFGVHALDIPRLPSAYGLAFLAAFTLAGAVIYWMERYR